jgi:twitching motility protein PilT
MSDESSFNNTERAEKAFDIAELLKFATDQKCSDIHLRVGSCPMVRRDGIMVKTDLPPLSKEDMQFIAKVTMPEKLLHKSNNDFDFDYSYEIEGIARFRVNLLHELGNLGFVFRIVPLKIPSMENLFLPPALKNFTALNNGLVLVTGPTGSGKTTTLASILDYLNQNQKKHVITIEDPIEFIHTNKNCIFTQRQLEIDTNSFPNGLKYALRQDPDVILIGEMRDRDTISSALKAAETGHLVFSTLHTIGAVETINRIINAFEPYERESIRLQVANTLRGTVAQKLARRMNNKGRVPATEIMIVTPAIKDYILKDEIDNIYRLISPNDYNGTVDMNTSLSRLVKAGIISIKEAIQSSNTPEEMEQMLKGVSHSTSGYTE